ncbi:SDR family NAD(P)-dependent oxidoreductase [Alkalicoccobacillus porphyridii]|uniref:Glucose 1-dehydrogenase n=1 Tax=Alkalicoccobacillus porphyridii TaxID=2597270 RepID=A0A554A077_9BACI|nr:glucose 1-dehydrogenase [Alkalicoccobacillus porphyridii]TSB47046.1 glucose 1-dehydrogenase [Alkalicoccobacillus porphyridii]
MKRLADKVALVTGGSRGIGLAIVERLAEEGAHVAINYYPSESKHLAEEVKKKIESVHNIKAMIIHANVGVKEEVEQMVTDIENSLGEVEILVNNAGIAPFESFLTLSEESWDLTYQTNVKSIFLLSQRVAHNMVKKRAGKIINITSTASVLVTSPVIPHYISSKAAATQLTKALAIELGRYQINVNAVGPSTIQTDMTTEMFEDEENHKREIEANPMKRIGTAKQIGDAVVFLASDEAEQVNGHLLMVDGGLTVKAAQPDDHLEH